MAATVTTRPIPSACIWGVVRDGRLDSAHREVSAARRAAGRDGLVASIEPTARRLGVQIGDMVSVDAGQVGPR